MELIIVSGLSGAGKSVALRTLEDIGFYCIDNLPLFLLGGLALGLESEAQQVVADAVGTAVGIDARSHTKQLESLPDLIAGLREHGISPRLLFLEASTDTLIKRFSETRRKHPLTRSDRSLAEAIELERALLEPLQRIADLRLDTTYTNVHELRDQVREQLGSADAVQASVLLQSFGFKRGVPPGVDFVFDVRCLPNPHWQPALRQQTGRDPDVIAFLEAAPEVAEMRAHLERFLTTWIPRFETDGRSYLTIGVGCTGGQHRSVYMVEALRACLEQAGHRVLVRHRELP
jgi:UPF0042 nucleotide-binding protein